MFDKSKLLNSFIMEEIFKNLVIKQNVKMKLIDTSMV
jgi:hypothetical protein